LHGYFGSKVSRSTIGIVGLGRIGCALAKRATGFDMKILYHNRNRKEVEEKQFGELILYLYFTVLFSIELKTFQNISILHHKEVEMPAKTKLTNVHLCFHALVCNEMERILVDLKTC